MYICIVLTPSLVKLRESRQIQLLDVNQPVNIVWHIQHAHVHSKIFGELIVYNYNLYIYINSNNHVVKHHK